jgi:hypothetical protein
MSRKNVLFWITPPRKSTQGLVRAQQTAVSAEPVRRSDFVCAAAESIAELSNDQHFSPPPS